MEYICKYNSKIGEMIIKSDGENITGLAIEKQTDFDKMLKENKENPQLATFEKVANWLDEYFAGKVPKEKLKLKLEGTEFQKEVWNILKEIPYGKTITYGEIANKIAKKRGIKRMSAQAVGGAVGSNPISIIVPCHRVIGKNGNLTGYNGGINIKKELLKIEGIL